MVKNIEELQSIAKTIRGDIVSMLTESASGHPGGSLSATDIVTTLFFGEMNIDPKNPKDEDRDRFVLSKGHAAPVLYSALARKGYFPVEELNTLRKINSRLQGHPSMRCLPGIDMSTGSLGQGISAAVGIALAGKIDKKDYRVYTVLGDGELEEGQVWEASMSAAHYKLNNLTAFIDFNGLQIDGDIIKVMNPTPIDKKFEAFGWNVLVIDGHNIGEILESIEKAKACKDKPTAVVCKTVKGKGVSFMENSAAWHGTAPNKEQCAQALAEIGGNR
ncbi:transketolase [Clostridium sp.]|uniref:transketolase n=1 Tax=Clostridium sp. TaxID=1506 RepID=UPI00260F6FC3|nr:transketolase [Clostridium sp.]